MKNIPRTWKPEGEPIEPLSTQGRSHHQQLPHPMMQFPTRTQVRPSDIVQREQRGSTPNKVMEPDTLAVRMAGDLQIKARFFKLG